MNSIMMVDGYDLPFDGVKRKRKAKKSRSRRAKKGASHGASWLCAGAKRKAACMRAVKAKKCKK